MDKYIFRRIEIRRVLADSCDSMFRNKKISDMVYNHICDDVEEFLDNCLDNCEVDDGHILK